MDSSSRHVLLVALLVGALLLVLSLLALFSYYPIYGMTLMITLYIIYLYLCTETHHIHRAQEFENRFWTILGFLCSTCLFFIPDSPLAIGHWNVTLGFVLVVMCTYGIHSYDRHLHRINVGRIPHLPSGYPGSRSRQLLLSDGTSVPEKCSIISDALRKIDSTIIPTNIQNWVSGTWRQGLEQLIIKTLEDTTPSELNEILPRIRLGLLLYKIKDHPAPNRTYLLDLLCFTRVVDLSVSSRALVLDALQQMKLTAHPRSEKYALNVILKTKGDHLSTLKCLTDNKGDFHSMHKLIFVDIQDSKIRDEVLQHIRIQAAIQAAHSNLGTRLGKGRKQQPWRKILSDVDDTLCCSGGHFPAGVDSSFPKKQDVTERIMSHYLCYKHSMYDTINSASVYPGVLDFYRELDLGVNGPDMWPSGRTGNLVFLSARPHVYKDLSEARTYQKFKKLQREKGLYSNPTLMAGSLETGRAYMMYNALEPLAQKKFENFLQLSSIYPEFKFVFIGDNGQGDVRAAELMCESVAKDRIEAIYMHQVLPMHKTYGYKNHETCRKWKKMKIFFFKDYISAAIDAYEKKLISLSGLRRVTEAAANELPLVQFTLPIMRENKRLTFNRSIELANRIIDASNSNPVTAISGIQVFEIDAQVSTPFGRGSVKSYRSNDGMYEVHFDWSNKNEEEYIAYLSSLQTTENIPRRKYLFGRINASASSSTSSTVNEKPSADRTPTSMSPVIERSKIKDAKSPATHLLDEPPETYIEPMVSPSKQMERTQERVRFESTSSFSNVSCDLNNIDCEDNILRDRIASNISLGKEVSSQLHGAPGLVTASSIPVVVKNIMDDTADKTFGCEDKTKYRSYSDDDGTCSVVSVAEFQNEIDDNPEVSESAPIEMFSSALQKENNASMNQNLSSNSSTHENICFSNDNEKSINEQKVHEKRYIFKAFLPLSALKPAPPVAEDISKFRLRLQKEKEAEERKAKEAERRIQKLKATAIVVGSVSNKKNKLFGNPADEKRKSIPSGTVASCFMGDITIQSYRADTSIYEVTLNNWVLHNDQRARAYLHSSSVALKKESKPTHSRTPSLVEKAGYAILDKIQYNLGLYALLNKKAKTNAQTYMPIVGEKVVTAFGLATITSVRLTTSAKAEANEGSDAIGTPFDETEREGTALYEVTFTDWKLSKGRKPSAVLNANSISPWSSKANNNEKPKMEDAVTKSSVGTMRRVLNTLGVIGSKEKNSTSPTRLSLREQFYSIGTLVNTPMGCGVVVAFRSSDGIYSISLLKWSLKNHKHAMCYLTNPGIREAVAAPGWVVATPFGVGVIESIRPTDGFIILSSMRAVQYLHFESKLVRVPAQIGDTVSTQYGKGTVLSYSYSNGTYRIDLGYGTLYSPHGSAIDSVISVGYVKESSRMGIMESVLKKIGFGFF